MRIGKVTENVLKRSVFKLHKVKKDQESAAVGTDCAVFAYNSRRASSVALLYINNFNAVFLAIIFYGNIYNIFPAV